MSTNFIEEFTIVLPCYNEAHRIGLSLPELFEWRKSFEESHKCHVKILLANDGCTDNTLELAKNMSVGEKNFDIVGYEVNQGRGAVLKVAFGLASPKSLFVLYMDSDLATDLKHVHDVWALYKEKQNKLMVCGNRYFPGNNLKRPLLRQIWSWGWKKFLTVLFWRKLPDTQCGFKALSYDLVEPIMNHLEIKGFVADVEMVIRAANEGAEIKSIDIQWVEKKGSTIRWSTVFKMLGELKILKLNLKRWLKKNIHHTKKSTHSNAA
jgi:glycosyltransferase involved in cell wall biosynthesis